MRALESEKQELTENVSSLHQVLNAMQRQLGTIQGEYTHMGESLHSPSPAAAAAHEDYTYTRRSTPNDENRDP